MHNFVRTHSFRSWAYLWLAQNLAKFMMFRFVNRNEEILKIKKTKIELVKALLVHCNIFFSLLFLSSHRNYFIAMNEWPTHIHTHAHKYPFTPICLKWSCVCVEWRVWVVHNTFVWCHVHSDDWANDEMLKRKQEDEAHLIKIWYFSFIWFSRSIDCRYYYTTMQRPQNGQIKIGYGIRIYYEYIPQQLVTRPNIKCFV